MNQWTQLTLTRRGMASRWRTGNARACTACRVALSSTPVGSVSCVHPYPPRSITMLALLVMAAVAAGAIKLAVAICGHHITWRLAFAIVAVIGIDLLVCATP